MLALSAVCAISVDHQPSALEKAVVGQRNDRQTGENSRFRQLLFDRRDVVVLILSRGVFLFHAAAARVGCDFDWLFLSWIS